jgi:4-hydroxybenzoate polyprenyltransferase
LQHSICTGCSIPSALKELRLPESAAHAVLHQSPPSNNLRPLCVDLDGTLTKSDTLWDSVVALLRHRPLAIFSIIGWIRHGKAAFKTHVTSAVELDVVHLPWNRPLLQYLELEHSSGRKIYLATAADGALARRIAANLGLFTDVLASDGATNLAGGNKLRAFQERFAEFDYIGNAPPDVPLLQHSVEPMVANPTRGLRRKMRANNIKPVQTFIDSPPLAKIITKSIRIHQWAKNVLIFLPLLLAHRLTLTGIASASAAFLSFSLCASSTYLVNDLLDIEADRRHPRKRFRPFAAGDLSIQSGCLLIALLFCTALLIATQLPVAFLCWLLIYTTATLAYSLRFKRMVLVDVIVLSMLYTMRLVAGSAATHVLISPWLAGFSIFFFLSLAMVKRFSELENLRARGLAPTNGRGYLVTDIEQLRSFGTASAYASVMVFTLYINAMGESHLYRHPQFLWLLVPLLILWLSGIWLLASRGQLDEDPVIFAITDRRSLALGVLVVGVVLLALFANFALT